MKTAVKHNLKSKTFSVSKNHTYLKKNEIYLVNFRFYQKLFVLLISLSTILIFPDSPRELGNICENYNSKKTCNIW